MIRLEIPASSLTVGRGRLIWHVPRRVPDKVTSKPSPGRGTVRFSPILNEELKAEMGRAISDAILTNAWRRLEFTHDPVRASLLKSAADAQRVGFLRRAPELSRLYDLDLLNASLREHKLPEVK